MVGVLTGAIFYNSIGLETLMVMNKDRFFFLLLPPIILKSSQQLFDREFFRNLGPILLFAVIGTVMNISLVAIGLHSVGRNFAAFDDLASNITGLETTMFSTIISAVDPVAVLTIFTELHINTPLYFIVFGEALFNDAVVVTIFTVVEKLLESEHKTSLGMTFLTAFGQFLFVFFGGVVIGIFMGLLTAFLTRFTMNSRNMEPMLVLSAAYLSYILAELVHLSSIVSLTVCGLMISAYVRYNLCYETNITLDETVEVIASISEILIFFLMGLDALNTTHHFDAGFILWTLVFCSAGRLLSVFLLTLLSNMFFRKNRPIDFGDQVIVAFAGLRGAIAWSLVNMLHEEHIHSLAVFKTTTFAIVLFTIFIFGVPITDLIALIGVDIQETEDNDMFTFVNRKVVETFGPILEGLAGFRTNSWSAWIESMNDEYLRRFLIAGGTEKVNEMDEPKVEEKVVDYGPYSGLFKKFDPSDFEASKIDSLIREIKATTSLEPLPKIISITRERKHVSSTIVKAFMDVEKEAKSVLIGKKMSLYDIPRTQPRKSSPSYSPLRTSSNNLRQSPKKRMSQFQPQRLPLRAHSRINFRRE